jgi:hypothetical protein
LILPTRALLPWHGYQATDALSVQTQGKFQPETHRVCVGLYRPGIMFVFLLLLIAFFVGYLKSQNVLYIFIFL